LKVPSLANGYILAITLVTFSSQQHTDPNLKISVAMLTSNSITNLRQLYSKDQHTIRKI